MNMRTLSLSEAATQLGLEPGKSGTAGIQKLRRMVLAGQLHAVRIGKGFRIPVTELERLLSSGAARSA